MKAFDGFKSEANGGKTAMLPAGPYVAKIINVKIDGDEPDQSLILRLDIAEGEYAGYYTSRYKADEERKNSQYPPKYKGDLRIRIPNPDNKKAMYPESDLRRFNDAMYRIEQSNPGYSWDWNERGLIGRIVGVNVRAGTYNDAAYTKPYRLEIADDVRKGIVQPMEPMQPRGDAYDTNLDQQSGFAKVETDELPF